MKSTRVNRLTRIQLKPDFLSPPDCGDDVEATEENEEDEEDEGDDDEGDEGDLGQKGDGTHLLRVHHWARRQRLLE